MAATNVMCPYCLRNDVTSPLHLTVEEGCAYTCGVCGYCEKHDEEIDGDM